MSSDFLKPKTSTPNIRRRRNNGQFVNPPTYMELGGFTSADKATAPNQRDMKLERGGPSARKGKPI